LEITLEENYGAGDEVRAATRLCLPFIPRLELIRLAELGLLGMSDGTIGSSKRLPFLKAQGGRHLPLQVRLFFTSRIGDWSDVTSCFVYRTPPRTPRLT
jgi:hypothetical protein